MAVTAGLTFRQPSVGRLPIVVAGLLLLCISSAGLAAVPTVAGELTPKGTEATTVLRAVISQGTEPPFAKVDGQMTRGVLPDWYRELLQTTSFRLEFVELPRNQLAQLLMQGKADLFCHSSPRWLTTPALSWSPALMRVRDLLVSRQPFADLATFERQYLGQIGTIRGYSYLEIDQSLLAARRSDSANSTQMLQAFAVGVTDAAIVSEAALKYYVEMVNQPTIALYDNSLHCAYSPLLPKTIQQHLNERISVLARRGKFDQIYHSYTGKGHLQPGH